jgi:hypothetical protein
MPRRKKMGFAGDVSICRRFKPGPRHFKTIHKYQEIERRVAGDFAI